MTAFTCKLCGKSFEGVRDPAPEFTSEEIEARRQAWLAAEEKLVKSPDNEHFVKAQQKAWFAYMATKSSGVERIPDEITTRKIKDGYILVCVEHGLEGDGKPGVQ